MNLREQEIENILRHPPRPAPPAGLKATLISQVRLAAVRPTPQPEMRLDASSGWFRRWWPVLLPTTVSLACGVVLWMQQAEISRLKDSIRALSPGTNTTETVPAVVPTKIQKDTTQADDLAAKEQQEIARLKQLAGQLATELERLQRMQTENESLRAQLSAPPGLTPEELDAFAKAKEHAMSIACVNNLKQFGLAVRLWAQDNNEVNPPDSLSMSNELNTPKILVCPADTNRVAASNWAAYTPDNCSYDFLASSVTNAAHEPSRVSVRCPIHGHVGLCDGSVQMGVARNHPEWLVERDGKLYMERKSPAPKR